MAKGYIIARITVTDPDAYAQYAAASAAALKTSGGKALAKGGDMLTLEGEGRPRNVLLEFESFEAAKNYYHSLEYQAAKAKREGAAIVDIIALQGAD